LLTAKSFCGQCVIKKCKAINEGCHLFCTKIKPSKPEAACENHAGDSYFSALIDDNAKAKLRLAKEFG
jgi:hypothetical protein